MVSQSTHSPEQLAILRWTVAPRRRHRRGSGAARGSVRSPRPAPACCAAERAGLLSQQPPLAARPRCTRSRAPACARPACAGFEPCRVSAASAPHAIACARVAAALERAYPDHRVMGERELRRDERESRRPARQRLSGVRARRRATCCIAPTWCCGRRSRASALPVAVEVELTVKAPAAPARDLSRVGALSLRRGHAVSRRRRGAAPARASDRASAGAASGSCVVALDALSGLRSVGARVDREYRPRRCVACRWGVNHLAMETDHVLLQHQPRRSGRTSDP